MVGIKSLFNVLQKPQSILSGMVLGAERELGLDTQWSAGDKEQNNADELWIQQLKNKGEDTSQLEASLTGRNNGARGITNAWDGLVKGAKGNIRPSDIIKARLSEQQGQDFSQSIVGKLSNSFVDVGMDPMNVIPVGKIARAGGLGKTGIKAAEGLENLGKAEDAGRVAKLTSKLPQTGRDFYHGLIGTGSIQGGLGVAGLAATGRHAATKFGETPLGEALVMKLAGKIPGNVGKLGQVEEVMGSGERGILNNIDEFDNIAGKRADDWLPGTAADTISKGRRVAGEVTGTANRRVPGSASPGGARRGVTDTRVAVRDIPSQPTVYDDLPGATDSRIGGPALPKATPLPSDLIGDLPTDSRLIQQMAADKPSLIEKLKTPFSPSAQRAETTAQRIKAPKTSAPVGLDKAPEQKLLDLLTQKSEVVPKRAPSDFKATPKATAVDKAITKRTPTKPRTDAQREARRVAAAKKRTAGVKTPKTDAELKALIGGNDGEAATALIEAILKDR